MSESVVELAIQRTKQGQLSTHSLLWTFAASRLIVPTPDANYDGNLAHFVPVLVGFDDVTFLVVFTSTDRIGRFKERGPQFIELTGAEIIRMNPPDKGLVVNPETSVGFEIPPAGLALFRAELQT